jgi:hypothetical protein
MIKPKRKREKKRKGNERKSDQEQDEKIHMVSLSGA